MFAEDELKSLPAFVEDLDNPAVADPRIGVFDEGIEPGGTGDSVREGFKLGVARLAGGSETPC